MIKMEKEEFDKKRKDVIEGIEPLMKAFDVEFDYILDEKGNEFLIIQDTKINCSFNSLEAIKIEALGYFFIENYCRRMSIGRFQKSVIKVITRHWIN
ncbi:MAG: hypothetical protein ACRC4W_08610 [Treponemataceae bacterium]